MIGPLGAVLLLLGCAPQPDGAALPDCTPVELEPGQVRACRLAAGQAPSGSSGRPSDWRLQNALLDLVVRDGYAPLTRLVGAGGTLVGAVVPGHADPVVELVPTLPGGWFTAVGVDAWQDEGAAWLVLEGVTEDGADTTLEYRLAADSVTVELAGASGLALRPQVGTERVGGTLELGEVVIAAAGEVTDLGGEVAWAGADRVHVGLREAVYLARWPDGVPVAGQAPDAEWVEARAGGVALARLPVLDGAFAGIVPPETDALVARAAGRADGPAQPPGADLALEPGAAGALRVRVVDDRGEDLWALVERGGVGWPVPPGGATLAVGPGVADTVVWAGPGHEASWHAALEIGGVAPAEVALDVVLDRVQAGGEAPLLAELGLAGWPDATVREPDAARLARAAGRGVGFAVVVADDEVAQDLVADPHTRPGLAVAGGSRAATADMGRPLAWPWTATTALWGHGAARWPLADPWQLLSLLDLRGARNVVLDLDWMDAAGPSPDGPIDALAVRLDAPEDLDRYLDLLDRGERLPPVGPWTWVEAVDPALHGVAEVERRLWESRTVATTGPSITLRVGEVGPGQVAWASPARSRRGQGPPDGVEGGEPLDVVQVRVQVATPAWAPVDEVALLGPDGIELGRWPARPGEAEVLDATVSVAADAGWVLAAAWGAAPSPLTGRVPWAVTAPVWIAP